MPTWGTSEEDWAKLRSLPNLTILSRSTISTCCLKRTRVMIVPSIWAEARSRIVVEAMAHGVPVMASKIGGLPEAKMGVPYLLPIHPITRYRTEIDANMVPIAEVPPQDLGPWINALTRLTSDREHYTEISRASRAAAHGLCDEFDMRAIRKTVEEMVERPVRRHAARTAALSAGSAEGARVDGPSSTKDYEHRKRSIGIGFQDWKAPPANCVCSPFRMPVGIARAISSMARLAASICRSGWRPS